MVVSEGNKRVLNDCCSKWTPCNFVVIDFDRKDFKVAIKRTKYMSNTEHIGFWTRPVIERGAESSGIYYTTHGSSGGGSFSLPEMNEGDVIMIEIKNSTATFKLNGQSATNTVPSGVLFGIWAYYKGSEYQIVEFK
ncbi:hypothetical protein GEMRC1_009162 [Eukaryota sp. GEM-RC1]